jgi:serine/threonine-protein kinase
MPAPLPSPFREGDVVAGKYAIERVLGRGGMGIVVSAQHLQLRQRVAIKFLLWTPEMSADTIPRFLREAQAAARIQSERVVRVLDVATLSDGVPYMVMEFLDGRDLSQLLTLRGPLPLDEAVGYMLQACEGVAEAHAAGIVHRDIKPANLFVCDRGGGRSLVKVLDFGISKSKDPKATSDDAGLTKTSAVMGSPLYMSPEQMASAKYVDVRTDIWSLAVSLFELVTGKTPFTGDSMTELIAAVLQREPLSLRALRADLPEAFANALARALEKDRERRYAHVAEFAAAIAPFGPRHSDATVERISDALGRTRATGGAAGSGGPRDLAFAFQKTAESSDAGAPAVSAGGGTTAQPVSSEPTGGLPSSRRRSTSLALIGLGIIASAAVAVAVMGRHSHPVVAGTESTAETTVAAPAARAAASAPPVTSAASEPAPLATGAASVPPSAEAPLPAAPTAPSARHAAAVHASPPAPVVAAPAKSAPAARTPASEPSCKVVQYIDAEGDVRFRRECP